MRVSATLIVRDESPFIEGCLASLLGFVDEIILVDTGSRDDTTEIAERYSIKLHSFPWRDDFSAARNYAIAQAKGDWILYIDADERLEVPERQLWNDVLADSGKAAWKLRFYPRVGWTPYAELRLFRNDPRIRFRGVIHERVQDSVGAVCQADGREIGCCEICLHHVGYESDQSHKLPRNIPLLKSYISHDPERVYCWWHLGDMLQLFGDEDGAAEAWREGIKVARSQTDRLYPLSNGLPFVSLIALQCRRGIPCDDLIDESLRLFPKNLYLQWFHCQLALERGNGELVRNRLEKLAAIDPDGFYDPEISYDKTLFSYTSRETLALCHFRAGRYGEAAHWYRLASAAAPDPHACEVRALLAQARATQNANHRAEGEKG
jgi:glycosyltransferase involved in cell wall biosynthesis